jgi:hypothetical protein
MLLAIALAACARRAPSASVSPTAAAPPVATSPPGPRVWPRPLTPEERADFIARAHRAEVNPRRARDGEDLDSPVGWMAQLQEVPYTLCMLQSRDWNRYDYPLADMAIMGTGTFVLEHATAPIDIDAASLAGLRTVVPATVSTGREAVSLPPCWKTSPAESRPAPCRPTSPSACPPVPESSTDHQGHADTTPFDPATLLPNNSAE